MGDSVVFSGRRVIAESDRRQGVHSPPPWVLDRDTLCFLVSIPAARNYGDNCPVMSCTGSAAVAVEVTEAAPADALPEFCIVLPSGEVLDLEEYGDGGALPREVANDENAAVQCQFTLRFETIVRPSCKREHSE